MPHHFLDHNKKPLPVSANTRPRSDFCCCRQQKEVRAKLLLNQGEQKGMEQIDAVAQRRDAETRP